jgi:hypothetical protein
MEVYIKDFEKKFPATYVEQAEKIHAEFLAEFPKDKLSEMELDCYALGRSGDCQGSCRFFSFETLRISSVGFRATWLILVQSLVPLDQRSGMASWESRHFPLGLSASKPPSL